MTHRALVVGAGNAGKAHAEALETISVDVVGPLSGMATVTRGSQPGFAALRRPAEVLQVVFRYV